MDAQVMSQQQADDVGMGNDDNRLFFVAGGDLLNGLDGPELDFAQGLALGEAHPTGEKLDGPPQGFFGQLLDLLAFPFPVFHLGQIIHEEGGQAVGIGDVGGGLRAARQRAAVYGFDGQSGQALGRGQDQVGR